MKPRLIVEQKITAFVNKYRLFAVNDNGEKGNELGLAQQKRLAFKEKVTFYTDEQKTQEAFTFRAEKVMDIHGNYFVEDTSGQLLGSFQKQFKASLLNSTWHLKNAAGETLYVVKESNDLLAAMRRFGGMIPIVGDIIDIICLLLKYHFVFLKPDSQEVIGTYQKTTLFRDHYTLSLTDEAVDALDWRVYAALGVGLDALQSR